ncbi:MAG: hypothetical protein ABJD02_20400 [Paraglaciecola sp.]|uniref:hypothetical protein n=1 Tax=Paraglaciecola sp. TaxID=1920173 RepID=UPI003263E04A
MRVFILFVLCLSFNSFAGMSNSISFQEAAAMGVRFNIWEDITDEEKVEYLKFSTCAPITISVPLTDKKHKEFTEIKMSFELIKDDKVFLSGQIPVSPMKANTTGIGYGCLPLGSEFQINFSFSYNPINGIVFCPPSYKIIDLVSYINSAYNK